MADDGPLATDSLDALARGATLSRIAAAALRWLGGCAVGSAALLALALALASFERGGSEPSAETSASAYLDFDLAVLRELGARTLKSETDPAKQEALRAAWAHRPPWRLPQERTGMARIVSPREAWAAVTSDKSRFRTAARGAFDALPFLLAGLALAFSAAGAGGALAQLARTPLSRRWQGAGRAAFVVGLYLLVLHPLLGLLDPGAFYDRTRSFGSGLSATLFVAGFAGTLSGAAARSLFAPVRHAQHLSALARRPKLLTAVRLSVLDAAEWLVPLVPALAAAALFVCAKADQDAVATGAASGLGALVRAAMREPSVGERLSSCALVGGALVFLCWAGHRFVLELRSSLGAGTVEP